MNNVVLFQGIGINHFTAILCSKQLYISLSQFDFFIFAVEALPLIKSYSEIY